MEGRKPAGSSSSLTSELCGSKDSSSSSGIFGAIFAPPSTSPKVLLYIPELILFVWCVFYRNVWF